MQKHLLAPFKSCMQQKALYKFFFISCFVGLFLFFFLNFFGFVLFSFGFFCLFFNIVRFNFSLGGIRWFSIFFFYFIELEVLWKGRTLSMNCNYTAADGSEPFYVPAPIKNVDK